MVYLVAYTQDVCLLIEFKECYAQLKCESRKSLNPIKGQYLTLTKMLISA